MTARNLHSDRPAVLRPPAAVAPGPQRRRRQPGVTDFGQDPRADRAFSGFYLTHWTDVSRALVLALNDEQLGVEAAAEAFSRAYEHWGSISEYGNPQGWVYRVGLNWGRSWLRRLRTARRRQEYVREGTIDTLPDPDLERAVSELPEPQRDVVILRFFLDLSVIETAESLGVAPGTVKSRLSRALAHLQHLLRDPASPP